MKQVFLSVIVFFLCSNTVLLAQHGGNSQYDPQARHNRPNDVDLRLNAVPAYSFSPILEASVMVNVKAQSFVAIFSITQFANTIGMADTLMNLRIERFRKMLEQVNITRKQTFADAVSLVPTYEFEVTNKQFSKTLTEIPTGFEIKKNVHITFYDHEQANALIAAAARAEIYDLVKVDYVIENMEAVYQQARLEALAILEQKRKALEKAGVYARFTQVGEKNGSAHPYERYAQYYASKTGMAPSFAGNYRKQPAVQYNYADKNRTIYYDKVSDKQFDRVIDPVVSEPMVQLYVSVKAQYETFDPELIAEGKEQKANNKDLAAKQRRIQELEAELRIKQLEQQMEELEKKKKK
jgi:uncharacterized protein YggE